MDQMMQKAEKHDPSGYFLIEVSTYIAFMMSLLFLIDSDWKPLLFRMYSTMIWGIHQLLIIAYLY